MASYKNKERKCIQDNKDHQTITPNEKGKSFEQKVGEIFRLMGFEPDWNRKISGYEIDVFIKKKKSFGEKYEYYLIECKDLSTKAGQDVVNRAFTVREAVKNDLQCQSLGKDFEVMIVSAKGFTDSAIKAASAHGIILFTYKDLQNRLMNFDHYLSSLIEKFESSSLNSLYIEPYFYSDTNQDGINAFQFIKEWLLDPKRRHLSLLGDYGTGKTSFAEVLAYKMALDYRNEPGKSRIPFLVNLGECRGSFTLKSLLHDHLKVNGVKESDAVTFLNLLFKGHILLIFDSFDEMAVRNSDKNTISNFEQLNQAARSNAKVILTSRTHYFRDKLEMERILKKQGTAEISNLASILFQKISNKEKYEIIHLKEFSDHQIQEYLQKAIKVDWESAYHQIKSICSLNDLSSRPILLDMIVKILPEIEKEKKKFNLTHLYEIYMQDWLERDNLRLQITKEIMEELFEGMACLLRKEGKRFIHYSALANIIKESFKENKKIESELEIAANELRTAPFLARDDDGNYSFAHESFAQFFIARKIKKELLKKNFDILDLKLLSYEIVFFLGHLMGDNINTLRLVIGLLEAEYSHQISENALFIFYIILKMIFFKQQFSLKENIEFSPSDVKEFKEEVQSQLPKTFNLQGAVLSMWHLPYMIFNNANFTEAFMDDSVFNETSFENVSFIKTRMKCSNFNRSSFKNVRFEQVIAHHSNFKNCRFENCTIVGSDLSMSNFIDVTFDSCIIQGNDFTASGFYQSGLDIEMHKDNCYLGAGMPKSEAVNLEPLFVDQGHQNIVRAITTSIDGRFIVSGSDDKTVKLWDMEKGHLIKTLEGHDGYVLSVFISPDNRRIVSASSDKTVKLWDLEGGHLIFTLEGHKDWVNSVFVSQDNQLIVSGSSDRTVKLWSMESGCLVKTLEGHNRAVLSVFISPDCQCVVSGSSDHTMKLWSLASGSLIKTFQCQGNNVWSISISQDNRQIASGGDDKTVKLWDMESGHLVRTLEGHKDWVRSVFISPDNQRMISGSDDGTVKLWDLRNGNLIKSYEGHNKIVSSVFISPDNRWIVSGSFDMTIKMWDIDNGKLIRTLENHKKPVISDITHPENLQHLYYRDHLALYPAADLPGICNEIIINVEDKKEE